MSISVSQLSALTALFSLFGQVMHSPSKKNQQRDQKRPFQILVLGGI